MGRQRRPNPGIRVNNHPAILGLDLGGSSVKAALVTSEGQPIAHFHRTFDPSLRMDFADTTRQLLAEVEKTHGRPARVGFSAPGLAAPDARTIAFMPGRLDGLVGLDWTHFLGFSPAIPVLNDAQAALLGEVWVGAARGHQNVAMLTLGTGVGGAAMVDGHLLRGHTGKAGHLGHVCLDPEGIPDITGTPGSLEDAIGNCSIGLRTAGRYPNTHALIEAHRQGDAEATRIWMRSVRALACAIGSFTNILDPEVVIVGGGIAQAGALLFEPLRLLVSEVEWKVCQHEVRLLPAQLGDQAGAYGAARYALLHVWPE